MPDLGYAKVVDNREIAPGLQYMALESKVLAKAAKPGQFVHIKCGNTNDPLLRRPISIYRVDRASGNVELVFQVIGKGTALLAGHKSGDYVDILGPLGNGFSIPKNKRRVAVIGGGIGTAPLLFLLEELIKEGIPVSAFLGFKTAGSIFALSDFDIPGCRLNVATDDGSYGYHGFVTALFKNTVAGNEYDYVYGCGPKAMLKDLVCALSSDGIDGEISLEERMGCGIGACLGCACKIKSALNSDGFEYRRVCLDGPVFKASEVIFD